jgi:uncharacterized protein YaiI (UPF0178 family)
MKLWISQFLADDQILGYYLCVIQIFIDADGSPVKDEVYKVAGRYKIKVYVVANKYLKVPMDPLIEMSVAPSGFDAVDDWIVERITNKDIVVTADILLAERCIKKGARALGNSGHEFTEDNIGSAVSNRELMQNLRHMGEVKGGPPPMDKTARSRFLGKLDQIIQALKRV